MKTVIGITDCEKYPNYEKWIRSAGVDVMKLSHKLLNAEDLKKCSGLVLTGGDDVHPRFYGSTEIHYANAPEEFVEDRDAFEIQTFREAKKNNLPVLAICRGLQLVNCVLGGTLKQDLGEMNEVHRRTSNVDKVHEVKIGEGSILRTISKQSTGKVNSSHHQAIDRLGNGVKINCQAIDGTIEGIEGSEAEPFLLAVQWHPERMEDQNSPLSKNIRDSFIEAAKSRQAAG